MTPRTYRPDRTPALRIAPQSEPQNIPVNAKLYSIREASRILLELYGEGYSESSIRDLIDNGDWIEGVHWSDRRRKGGKYRKIKVCLESVQRWQVTRYADR